MVSFSHCHPYILMCQKMEMVKEGAEVGKAIVSYGLSQGKIKIIIRVGKECGPTAFILWGGGVLLKLPLGPTAPHPYIIPSNTFS